MSVSYKYHRFPIEVIRHCVWLYYTFPLSYRDIEKKMLYRGIEVTYESIRKWCKKFAQAYANQQQTATEYRATMRQRLSDWQQFTRLSAIA